MNYNNELSLNSRDLDEIFQMTQTAINYSNLWKR